MSLPKIIAFVITSRCNLRCRMCFQYGERAQKLKIKGNAQLGNPKELSLPEIEMIINKINKYYPQNKKPELFITGGEPFIRKDMIEIIRYAASRGNRVTVNTNFSLVDKKMAKELVEIENFTPLVSIDGPEEIHDKIRGIIGTYGRAIRNIKFFTRKERVILVCTTITKYNVNNLVDIYKKLRGLKVHWDLKHVAWMPKKYADLQNKMSQKYFNVSFKVYFPEKAAVPANKIKTLEDQLEKIRKLKKDYGVEFSEIARPTGRTLFEHHCTFSTQQKNKTCFSPEITILPDGNISFCNGGASGLGPLYTHVMHDELPKILEKRKSLEKIYNRCLERGEVFPVCVKCSYLVNKFELLERVKEAFKTPLGR